MSSRAASRPLAALVAALGAALLLLTGCAGLNGQSQSQGPSPDNRPQRESRSTEQRTAESSRTADQRSADGSKETAARETATSCADGSARRSLRLSGPEPQASYGGKVVEPHGATYYLRATVNDDGCTASGTFAYEGLGCSGTWVADHVEIVAEEPKNAVRGYFNETVTSDPQSACAPTAEVSLLYGPGGMFYFSSWVRGDGEATATKTHLDLL